MAGANADANDATKDKASDKKDDEEDGDDDDDEESKFADRRPWRLIRAMHAVPAVRNYFYLCIVLQFGTFAKFILPQVLNRLIQLLQDEAAKPASEPLDAGTTMQCIGLALTLFALDSSISLLSHNQLMSSLEMGFNMRSILIQELFSKSLRNVAQGLQHG